MGTPVIAKCNSGHTFRTEVKADSKGLVTRPACEQCGAPLHSHTFDFSSIDERVHTARRHSRS